MNQEMHNPNGEEKYEIKGNQSSRIKVRVCEKKRKVSDCKKSKILFEG